ncbi:NADH-ubiquinone oxidoreductase-F iron-sulfur binding region domain-containing protein [Candidatus Halobonum tyrrellensis]|uniref:NADH ubiquinone oxidoreductase, F subunit, iron sulfur binding protein n=1 Tax=Candidatus Halobonum tyrrellensis G22 TaxID=1324957 RepID=V4GUG5_9EURY|nr:NADH-ubiquinone oxidoreductase-F iron-sulfur binding region domain-containing protein [Candidatus Halobonum tyrrellensis]ESP88781.1 NADH ubiquinone oxidoreductase, F subunit, iron sulfur binding protein [Candidatus Halobonum tyrrellensis G22]
MNSIESSERTVVRVAAAGSEADPPEAVKRTDARVVPVGSTGVTALEPLVAVTRGGRTAFHARCSVDRLEGVVAAAEEADDVTAGDPDAVVDHDPDATRLPAVDLPGLSAGRRDVLGACGWRRPTSADDHEAAGGFADHDAADVFDAGADLRGRGWGDACHDDPVGESWATARDADGDAAVVVNAHGSPADALLLASAPLEVLDGATTLADAVGATEVVVYASSDDARAVETAREAVEAHPDPVVPVEVVTGPPEYRAGEPTMALEAIEGNHRLEARLRPPGPERVGLDGRPTLVHTPRTLAHLAVGLRGDDGDEGGDTRLVTVRGDVETPATVELPETASLSAAVDAVDVDGTLKAACVGGRFGGLTADLGVAAGPDALADAGLGTEGVVEVLSEGRCLVEFVGRRTRYAAEENCGRCVPCREGSTQLANLLRDVYDGEYDPEGVAELVGVMERSSICEFGVNAGRPARTATTEFALEFEAHADGQCPAGNCFDAREAPEVTTST